MSGHRNWEPNCVEETQNKKKVVRSSRVKPALEEQGMSATCSPKASCFHFFRRAHATRINERESPGTSPQEVRKWQVKKWNQWESKCPLVRRGSLWTPKQGQVIDFSTLAVIAPVQLENHVEFHLWLSVESCHCTDQSARNRIPSDVSSIRHWIPGTSEHHGHVIKCRLFSRQEIALFPFCSNSPAGMLILRYTPGSDLETVGILWGFLDPIGKQLKD